MRPTAPVRAALRGLDRFEWIVDNSERAQTPGARRIRRSFALALLGSGLVLAAVNVARGGTPGPGHVIMLMLALALYANSAGRFIRDWAPVLTIVIVYGLAFRLAEGIGMPVVYRPQIHVDRLIGLGTLPTTFLQQHLHPSIGIEAFCVLMYTTHFFFPLFLGFYLWWRRNGEGFVELMYTDIVLSFLAGITYIALPSAPPWLADQHGLVTGVHELLKTSLNAVGLHDLAALKGDPRAYNVTAAFPSIHAAFPVVGFLVIRKYRLPAWLLYLETVRMVGIWFVIVYTGEHYVVDVAAGVVYALVSWLIVQQLRGRARSLTAIGSGEPLIEVIRVPMRRGVPVDTHVGSHGGSRDALN
jgi:PAP2 superfamily protein